MPAGPVDLDLTALAHALIGEVGVLPGLLILALGWVGWREHRRANAALDSRIEDQKEHTRDLLEAMRSVDRAIDAVEGRRG